MTTYTLKANLELNSATGEAIVSGVQGPQGPQGNPGAGGVTPTYGTWTPIMSCDTPGDLNVIFSSNPDYNNGYQGTYVKLDKLVMTSFRLCFGLTHSTADGPIKITGLPFASSTVANSQKTGSFTFQGIVRPNYTQFGTLLFAGANNFRIFCAGQNIGEDQVRITNIPSGQNIVMLEGESWYLTD